MEGNMRVVIDQTLAPTHDWRKVVKGLQVMNAPAGEVKDF